MILPKVRDPRFVTIRRGGTLTDSDHHLLALWAASCAEHVLHFFKTARPEDPRPRQAIEHARAWARGEVKMTQARTAGGHAMGAARDLRGAGDAGMPLDPQIALQPHELGVEHLTTRGEPQPSAVILGDPAARDGRVDLLAERLADIEVSRHHRSDLGTCAALRAPGGHLAERPPLRLRGAQLGQGGAGAGDDRLVRRPAPVADGLPVQSGVVVRYSMLVIAAEGSCGDQRVRLGGKHRRGRRRSSAIAGTSGAPPHRPRRRLRRLVRRQSHKLIRGRSRA